MPYDRSTPDHPIVFEFILIEGFSMTSVITGIEPLRVANRILGKECYAWRLVHEGGDAPAASNGLTLPSTELDPEHLAEYTFVCAGTHSHPRNPRQVHGVLNRRHRRGKTVGAISLAPAILARAGLLAGRRAVIHWEGMAAFREQHPEIDLSDGLYIIEDRVVTSSGGLATLDLFLELLSLENEPWLVQAVANQLQVARRRSKRETQTYGQFRLPVTAPKLMHKCIALIEQNIEEPLPLDDLASFVGVSRRTLERQFVTFCGQTVGQFYMQRRLEHAVNLLLHAPISLHELAAASGFSSVNHFRNRFRRAYGASPTKWLENMV